METQVADAEMWMIGLTALGSILCAATLIVLTVPIWWRGLWSMVGDIGTQYKALWKEFLSKDG